jgi:hypothetical protein
VRILLDECLPRRLKRELPGHDVRTTPEMGWAGKRNGELLHLAEREFEVFLTVDRKLQRQQNLSVFNIAVIVMIARSNTLEDLQPLLAVVLNSLPNAERGQALVVGRLTKVYVLEPQLAANSSADAGNFLSASADCYRGTFGFADSSLDWFGRL